MELKLRYIIFNNVFYVVLIVPFMELKPKNKRDAVKKLQGLNRTFYGIETC